LNCRSINRRQLYRRATGKYLWVNDDYTVYFLIHAHALNPDVT